MSRAWRALALLGLLALAAGCAGFIEPRVPKEFRGKKVKEDPPLILLPGLPREALA